MLIYYSQTLLFCDSAKIVCYVSPVRPGSKPGPMNRSQFDYIRWSFHKGGQVEVCYSTVQYFKCIFIIEPSAKPFPWYMCGFDTIKFG